MTKPLKRFLFCLSVLALSAAAAYADDINCVRNNCLGTCVSKQEAMAHIFKSTQMTCNPTYRCYKDVDCEKGDDGKCGWVETADLKKCLAEKPTSPK